MNSEHMTRQSILETALEIVSKDRNQDYGNPEDNFRDIANLWNVQFGHMLKPEFQFEGHHVAQAMIHVKMSRLKTSPGKKDHYDDIAGYAACGGQSYSTDNSWVDTSSEFRFEVSDQLLANESSQSDSSEAQRVRANGQAAALRSVGFPDRMDY